MVSDGKLTVSWNIEDFDGLTLADDVIISSIEFTTLDQARDPNLEITSGVTPALAYNSALEALSVTSGSSLKQAFSTNELTVYPNPASDVLNIAGWNNENMSYSIISSTGHTIFSGTYTGGNSIEISDLRKGVYFIQLVDGENNVQNKKFIKH